MQLDFWNMYCNFHWHLEYKIFYILIIGKDKKILNRPQGAESWLSPSELKGLGFGFKYLGKCTRFYRFEHRSCSTRATETDWHYQCPGLNWDIFGIHPINSVFVVFKALDFAHFPTFMIVCTFYPWAPPLHRCHLPPLRFPPRSQPGWCHGISQAPNHRILDGNNLHSPHLFLPTRSSCLTPPPFSAPDVPPKNPEHLTVQGVRFTVPLGLPLL